MHTEAVFENIAKRIERELLEAKSSIIIAVAWFTNKNLFDTILKKVNGGCQVLLMITDDDINNNSQIDFDILNNKNSNVYKIPNHEKSLMHNKFCVIDNSILITGSYNWSYKAENNHENIVIHYDDFELSTQFVTEFNKIISTYFPKTKTQNHLDLDDSVNQIIKRLEVLKNYIILNDLDDIEYAISKLEKYNFNESINKIISLLKSQSFGQAVEEIHVFINSYNQLSIWNDPEISALQLEIRMLENQINAFENEKIDLEKLLIDFEYRHTKELGHLILSILKIRKEKYNNKESEKDFEDYQREYTKELQRKVFELPDEDKKILKKEYKNASILCHPDKFVNESIEVQKKAEEIFKELNEAQKNNDLERIREIVYNLKRGILSISTLKNQDKELLKLTAKSLKKKLNDLQIEIEGIKESETFIHINSLKNWDFYFITQKELLEQELVELQNEQ